MVISGPEHYFIIFGDSESNRTAIYNALSPKLETKIVSSFDTIAQLKNSIGAIGYVMDSQSDVDHYNVEQLHKHYLGRPIYIFTEHTSIPLLHFALRMSVKDVFQIPLEEKALSTLVVEINDTTNITCFDLEIGNDIYLPITDDILTHPLSDLFQLIEKYFVTGPSLKSVSNKLFLSPSRISHMFKDICGIGYSQYILCRRLEESEYLLKDTADGITAISYKLGFSNPSHFCRSFKEHIGITPTAFMKNESGITFSRVYQCYKKLRMEYLPNSSAEKEKLQNLARDELSG